MASIEAADIVLLLKNTESEIRFPGVNVERSAAGVMRDAAETSVPAAVETAELAGAAMRKDAAKMIAAVLATRPRSLGSAELLTRPL
jgi:hypothetical protein